MAVVLIGLAAVLVIGFVGRATSGAFDEAGNRIDEAGRATTTSLVASPGNDVPSDVFDELHAAIEGIDALGSSLVGKANEAESRYLAGDADGATDKLDALIKEVDVQQGNQLTFDEAASIRHAAQRLVDTVGVG
jgi:hypothetical protein